MLPTLELRDVRAFLALAEELHYGRAAERLMITPSCMSQIIRRLEARIGGRLFDRTSRRVRLTPVGAQLLADTALAWLTTNRTPMVEAFIQAAADVLAR